MKILFILIVTTISTIQAQGLINASVNTKGELEITPSMNSSQYDFDFLEGKWETRCKSLKTRLNHCTEWIEFNGNVENRTILNGLANFDLASSTRSGVLNESLSLRIFNPETRLWSLYWVGATGVMDPAVVGSFEDNIGTFYGRTVFNGVPVLVMFKWNKTNPDHPEWRQAYSTDNGKTWEWNSVVVSAR